MADHKARIMTVIIQSGGTVCTGLEATHCMGAYKGLSGTEEGTEYEELELRPLVAFRVAARKMM